MEKNNKIVFLKFLAIILVVFGHSIIIYDNTWGLYTTTVKAPILQFIKQSINIVQMPLWFGISGYLFYYSKEIKFKKVLLKKIKRLIIPFISIALFWLIPIRYLVGYDSYINNNLIYVIIKFIILGKDVGHLWYLPTLFSIFIIMNLYKRHNNINIINKNLDIIILAFLTIISFLGKKLPTYIGYVATYCVYFYIGMIINKYKLDQKKLRYIILVYIIIQSMVVCFINDIHVYMVIKQTLAYVFLFMIFNINTEKFESNKIIKEISDNSYGIYLLHSPLIYITFSKIPNINPYIMIFINFIIMVLIAYCISKLISKSKIKFIIGL